MITLGTNWVIWYDHKYDRLVRGHKRIEKFFTNCPTLVVKDDSWISLVMGDGKFSDNWSRLK